MVTAGVYLAGRAGPIFYSVFLQFGQSQFFFELVAWIGAFTTFMAATQAVVSKELKKLLAYSTVSQIGYMMLGIGAGGLASQFVTGLSAGIFHLMTHALFKAAAFLGAGAILHSVESRFMEDMGGLRHSMRITFISMLVSLLALSGVPPLSGFWSKDAIIAVTVLTGQLPLMLFAWGTVALTFLYSLKLIGLVFCGKESDHIKRMVEEGHHIHEAPPVMWLPYAAMAMVTVAIGLAGPYVESFFAHSLAFTATPIIGRTPSLGSATEEHAVLIGTLGSLAMLIVGGLLGYLMYVSGRIKATSLDRSGPAKAVYDFLWNRWYINPAYYRIFVYGSISFASTLWKTLELRFFDRISDSVANLSLGLSRAGQGVDLGVVDSGINGIASTGRRISLTLRKMQTGIPQDYVTVFAVGLFVLLVAVLFFFA
jgi:NADH-quinone oxidoreductase subunit L